MKKKNLLIVSLIAAAAMLLAACSSNSAAKTSASAAATATPEVTVEATAEIAEESAEPTAEDITLVGTSGTLVDAEGNAVSGASISITVDSVAYASASTDSTGAYTIAEMPVNTAFDMSIADSTGSELAASTIYLVSGSTYKAIENTDGSLYLYMEDDAAITLDLSITADSYIDCEEISAASAADADDADTVEADTDEE